MGKQMEKIMDLGFQGVYRNDGKSNRKDKDLRRGL